MKKYYYLSDAIIPIRPKAKYGIPPYRQWITQ